MKAACERKLAKARNRFWRWCLSNLKWRAEADARVFDAIFYVFGAAMVLMAILTAVGVAK